MSDSELPTVIVLDSNVWLSEGLLRSPDGRALLQHLRADRGHRHLAIPEVVEAETKAKSLEKARAALDEIQTGARQLRSFYGHDLNIDLPSSDDLGRGFHLALDDIRDVSFRVPITMTHVRQALSKVIDRLPPNTAKDEQFRDTLLWEATASLMDEYVVYFVTQDLNFFEGRDKRTFSLQLLNTLGVPERTNFHPHSNLFDCLKELNAMTVMPNRESNEIINDIANWIARCVEEYYNRPEVNFKVARRLSGVVFVRDPSDRQVEFEIIFSLAGAFRESEWAGSLRVRGAGVRSNSTVTNVMLSEVDVNWPNRTEYGFDDRRAKYRAVDSDRFRISIYQMGVIGAIETWQKLFDGYGIESEYSEDADGKMVTMSITGNVPALGVWRALLADIEQRGYWELTVEGPIPWRWEEEAQLV